MSHSTKKMPIVGNTTAVSEKLDKRLHNRAYRRRIKQKVSGYFAPHFDEEQPLLPLPDDISTPWQFNKDGKQYLELNSFIEQIRDGFLFEIPRSLCDRFMSSVNGDASQLSLDSILELAKERLRNNMRK